MENQFSPKYNNVEMRFFYEESNIKNPFLLNVLVGIGILVLSLSFFYTHDIGVGVFAVILTIFTIGWHIQYLFNKKISFVVDPIDLTKFYGAQIKWKIPISSITEIGSSFYRTKHDLIKQGLIIKTTESLYKINYDLEVQHLFISELKRINKEIKWVPDEYGYFGKYKGNKLTREYFWRNIWKSILVVLCAFLVMIFFYFKYSAV